VYVTVAGWEYPVWWLQARVGLGWVAEELH